MTRKEFDNLYLQMEIETNALSGGFANGSQAYADFIKIGKPAIPFLIEKLGTNPGWACLCLISDISEVIPVKADSCGKYEDVINDYKEYFSRVTSC